VQAETKELWLELSEQAANEQDPHRLGKLVPLDTGKTNEDGKTVHEECYLLRLRLRGRRWTATTQLRPSDARIAWKGRVSKR